MNFISDKPVGLMRSILIAILSPLATGLIVGISHAADYPPRENEAFVCDKPSVIYDESLWSSVLNAEPMPSGATQLVNATDKLTVENQIANSEMIRVPVGTTIETLNAALNAPSNSIRRFFFEAEKYYFTNTIVITQPVQLIGTNTNANNESRDGQRTRIIGSPGIMAAIKASADDRHNPNNVTIKYLTVENYSHESDSTPENRSLPKDAIWAIDSQDHNRWVITNNRIVDNGVSGLRAGSKAVVSDNCFETNGRYGMSETLAFDQQIYHNEFWRNGVAWNDQPNRDQGDHGAMKIFASRTINMGENWVHENIGRGIWFDTNNSDVIIQSNTVENNDGHGIMYETSYNALIDGNIVKGNNVVARSRAYPGTPTNAGIFISNSGGATLVGGPNREPVPGLLITDNTLRVQNNRLEDNRYGITLFQDADRFCSSNDESSRQWCTLTGGRRSVFGKSQLVEFKDDEQNAPINAPDLTSPANNSAYTSCINLAFGQGTIDSPFVEDLRTACFWNTTGVIVTDNDMIVVDPDVTQPSLVFQHASNACVYKDQNTPFNCIYQVQFVWVPDDSAYFLSRVSPFTYSGDENPTYFLDQMISSNQIVNNNWVGVNGPPLCPRNIANVDTQGQGQDRYCTAWYTP